MGQNVCCSAVQTYTKPRHTQTFEYFCKVFFSFKKKKFGKFFFLKFYFLFRIISINLTPNTLYKIMFFNKNKNIYWNGTQKKPKLIFITSLVHACVCAETNFFLKWKKIQFIFIIKIKSTVFFPFSPIWFECFSFYHFDNLPDFFSFSFHQIRKRGNEKKSMINWSQKYFFFFQKIKIKPMRKREKPNCFKLSFFFIHQSYCLCEREGDELNWRFMKIPEIWTKTKKNRKKFFVCLFDGIHFISFFGSLFSFFFKLTTYHHKWSNN